MTISELEELKVKDPEAFKKYMQEQTVHALRHKFFISERAGKDMGEAALQDFVDKYAAQFREEYESGKWQIHEDGICMKDQETSSHVPVIGFLDDSNN